jgi:hypothetical protein
LADSGQFGLSEEAIGKLTSLVMDGSTGEPTKAAADEPEAPEGQEAAEEEGQEPEVEAEGEEAAEDEAKDEGQKFTVRVDGKDVQVSESELISGYQRQADYTQKTQALASDRRELDGAKETLIQSRRQELEQLQIMLGELQARFPIQNEWAELEAQKEMLESGEYARRYIELQAKEGAIQRARQAVAQREAEQRAALYPVEEAKLYERVPEWRDVKVRQEEAKAVSAYLTTEGFSQEELSEILDHRSLAVARKAWLYEKLTSSKAGLLQKKVGSAPKVVRPGVKADPGQASIESRAGLREKLARSGSLHDAASLMESLL